MKYAAVTSIIAFFTVAAVTLPRCDDSRNTDIPESWSIYSNDQFNFTFRYPSEALVDIINPAVADEPRRVRVRLIGPKNKRGSEITDGFTFYARSVETEKQETLKEIAQHAFNSVTRDSKGIDTLNQGFNIGNRRAYYFSIRTKLGDELQYAVVEGRGDLVFVTAGTVNFPNHLERNYINIIHKMTSSFKSSAVAD